VTASATTTSTTTTRRGSGYTYELYGFLLRSEIELPGPRPGPDYVEDVFVCLGDIPPHPEGKQVWTEWNGRVFNFAVPGLGRFRVSDGELIVVDPAPGASERHLAVYVLGSAMGALLHQRTLLPLHANAIAIGKAAVAFTGPSGAGKSTLAAWFADSGYRILCDDICALEFDFDQRPAALPGVSRLRLRRDAILAARRKPEDYPLSFEGQDKYDVPPPTAHVPYSLPLVAIYAISGPPGEGEAPPAAGAEPLPIRRLSGVDAVEAIVANMYRGRFATMMGYGPRQMALSLAAVANTRIYAAPRRWGHDCYDSEAHRLWQHAIQVVHDKAFF
jgi:hypothetical protein